MEHGPDQGYGLRMDDMLSTPGPGILIKEVFPSGLTAGWNATHRSHEQIQGGDRILSVNHASQAEAIFAEMRRHALMRFRVQKGPAGVQSFIL